MSHHPEVVFVTINYRLNLFGFLDTGYFDDGDEYPGVNGNQGILD